jgi:D-alanyl-lipoteichoic acid acyltransferase DltB (MBOAT superfamily)
LAAIVLLHFGQAYPASQAQLTVNGALGVFLLAVFANIAYCIAYVVEIFAQPSDYRDLWWNFRGILFLTVPLVAGIVRRLFALGIFSRALLLGQQIAPTAPSAPSAPSTLLPSQPL